MNRKTLRGTLLLVFAAVVAVWLSAARSADAAVRYRLVDLGAMGDHYTAGTWINRHGEVTGTVALSDETGRLTVLTAFTWSRGVRTLIPCECNPSGINADGVVIGVFYGDSGFIYQDGRFTSVPHLPGADVQSDPWAINASGEIWGTGYFEDGHTELWRLRDGDLRGYGTLVPGATGLGVASSPRRGVVAGGVYSPDGSTRGFVWDHGNLTLLGKPPGSISAGLSDINRNSVAVGTAVEPGEDMYGQHRTSAVRFTATGARRLPRLANSIGETQARAINDHGLIVGTDATMSSVEAVIWKHGRIIRLNRITRMPSGWEIGFVWDVNNHGAITADAMSPDGYRHTVVLKPVREPQLSGAPASRSSLGHRMTDA